MRIYILNYLNHKDTFKLLEENLLWRDSLNKALQDLTTGPNLIDYIETLSIFCCLDEDLKRAK